MKKKAESVKINDKYHIKYCIYLMTRAMFTAHAILILIRDKMKLDKI